MSENKISFIMGGQSSGKLASILSNRLDCGCVVGYYWCSKHDIYSKQESDDMPHRVTDFEGVTSCCSCHISAPCSFCVNDKEDETE